MVDFQLVCLSLYVYLSISLSVSLSLCKFIYLLYVYLSVSLSVSLYLSLYKFIYLLYVYLCKFICLSALRSILSICLHWSLSVNLSGVFLSVCLSVHISVLLFVCTLWSLKSHKQLERALLYISTNENMVLSYFLSK